MFTANEFLAFSEDEMMRLFGIHDVKLTNPAKEVTRSEERVGQGPPPSFDWRIFGAVSSPRAGSVLSPFLEAAVSTIESAYFRASGNLVEFSALEIEQCSDNPNSDIVDAFKYVAAHKRLGSLAGYGRPSTCAADSRENAMTAALVDKYTHLPAGDDYHLINAMMRYPILAGVRVSRQWQFYNSGVLSAADCPAGTPNHAVQIVAYTPGWYVAKNSWGAQWGESGYIRLQRGNGANTCGILNLLVEPQVD